jgi:hypothetical protein
MKILLDECVTKHFKKHLVDHEVFTVVEMKWSGLKNGKLMSMCIEHQFDLLLTIDKNLQFQQNLAKYPLIIVVLNSASSSIEELKLFLPSFYEQLPGFEKHKAYLVER